MSQPILLVNACHETLDDAMGANLNLPLEEFANMAVSVKQGDPPETLPAALTVIKKKSADKKRVSLKGAKVSMKHWQKKKDSLTKEVNLLKQSLTFEHYQSDPKKLAIISKHLAERTKGLSAVEENLNKAVGSLKVAEAEALQKSKDAEEELEVLAEAIEMAGYVGDL